MATEIEFIRSAIVGIILSMSFAFVVLVIATLNIIIAIYATFCISCIVCSMMCFASIIGWEFGVALSIAVVILIGFSVDYIVHLANHYVSSAYKHRSKRTQHSLQEVGISIFAGAITTALSGIALYFCQLLLFNLFATLIIMTITFSLIFSFGLFSALCHAIGPNGTCGDLNYWVVQPVWRFIKRQAAKCKKSKVNDKDTKSKEEDSSKVEPIEPFEANV